MLCKCADVREKPAVAAVAAQPKRLLAVLYGSQTGTAESYAKMVGMYAASHGFEPHVSSLNDGAALFTSASALTFSAVVIVCSTYGTGEFPSNAKAFWKLLSGGQLPRLVGLRHAILGLGNSHNDHYNAAAKSLAAQLKTIGSPSLMQLQLSCELQANGHDGTFRTWKSALWRALGAASQGRQSITPAYAVQAGSGAAEACVARPGFGAVRVSGNALQTPAGYEPRVRVLRLAVDKALQQQQLGRAAAITDHIVVYPRNSVALVDRALRRLGLDGNAVVELHPLAGASPNAWDRKKLTTRTVLTEIVDLSAVPSRSLLETLSMAAESAADVERLETIAGDLSASGPYDQLIAGAFGIVDALEMFPSVRLTLAQLLTVLPHASARSYSVAACNIESAIAASSFDTLFDILYSVPVRRKDGRFFEGLCTSMLDKLQLGDRLLIKLEPSEIGLPRDDAPCLLIALGTGIGSAHSILQHRYRAHKQGQRVGATKLYYGMKYADRDCFFKGEFDEMCAAGFLTVTYCASNSGPRAMDRLDASLVDFIGGSGHVAYCGPGGSAPLALESNLRRCGFDVSQLRKEGRLHEEFFTADVDSENLFKNATTNDGATTLAGRMGKCDMFCFQCEQTFKGKGCFKVGVCGKTAQVSALQDLTIEGLKVLSFYAHELRTMGVALDDRVNRFTLYALFATLTNVNFDETRFVTIVAELKELTSATKAKYKAECGARGVAMKRPQRGKELPATLASGAAGVSELEELGREVGVLGRFSDPATQSAAGVTEMLVYGIKGIAAYADHSLMFGKELPEIYAFIHKALAFMTSADQYDLGKGLELAIEAGKINVTTMGLLYESNTTLGVPEITTVPLKPRAGKCIVVSGHDLAILKRLLEVTEPLGINVYTHGEMLPGHSYPLLKAHKNLAGHFGGAWMRQAVEFPHFPGPVLMTTNCITEPHESYVARIFTAGAVGWKGVPHIGSTLQDIRFDALIRAAQQAPGFGAEREFTYADPVGVKRADSLTIGFGHQTILSVAPTIVEEIKKGNITRFFLVGGCDGYEGERSYYTDLVARLPKTAVVLTVGCGKFRFNHMNLGTIGDTGIPRILDMGQCNDSFSAVQVALALAKVLNCQVSDLPLSIVLSWFEQKAIAVLLSCLALGLKPIHVGPALPAFVTPDVLNVLVTNYGIRALGDVNEDLRVMLAAPGAS